MTKIPSRKLIALLLGLVAIWAAIRYALPIAVPFLLGLGAALAAEPVVGLLDRRLRFPRWLASALGVTLVFLLLLGLVVWATALLLRQAGRFSAILPQLTTAAQSGLGSVEGWLLDMALKSPAQIRPLLTGAVTELFSGSGAMMEGVLRRGLELVYQIVPALTDGLLGLFTGILAAYMISIRLPRLSGKTAALWQRCRPMLLDLKRATLGWLTAQLKLAGAALGILLLTFWALRIPYAPVWAVVIAIIDAFPILGCGTVLLPWGLICFLQGQKLRAIGLLGTYLLVWLTRSVLEPKLLGKELGLDPLTTLISVYAGLKLFGLPGMLLAPLLVMTAQRLLKNILPPTPPP